MTKIFEPLRKYAEGVLVVMMGVMFTAFIAQVVFRYLLNVPLGWSDEIANFLWLWGILWGAAFVMKNHEDIRFDMLYNLLPRKFKRGLTVFGSGALVLLLLGSLPKTAAYIGFMKVEKSPALGLPMHWVFGLYLVFVIAMVVRHSLIAWDAVQDKLVEDGHTLIDHEALKSASNDNNKPGAAA